MAQKGLRHHFSTISKNELSQRLQKDGLTETSLATLPKERSAIIEPGGFIFLQILECHKEHTFDGRSCFSVGFTQLNWENGEPRADDTMGVLRVQKDLYAKFSQSVFLDTKIAVTGFRVSCDLENTLSLILDERCTSGAIYIVKNDTKDDGGDGDSGAKAEAQSKQDHTKLAHIRQNYHDRVNVYGVVQYFKRFTDFGKTKLAFTITDPSLIEKNRSPIDCALTTDDKIPLPDIKQIGDIIRLHRIAVGASESGNLKLYGRLGTYGLSAVVWDGRMGENMTPRMSSSENYTLTQGDRQVVLYLRTWSEMALSPSSPHGATSSPDLVTCNHFPQDAYRDIFCQVIGLWPDRQCCILRVTDGTKSQFNAFKFFENDNFRKKIKFFNKELNELVGECSIDIFVYDQHQNTAMNLKARDFVRIVSLHSAHSKNQMGLISYTLHGRGSDACGRGLFRHEPGTDLAIDLRKRLDQFSAVHPSKPTASGTTSRVSSVAHANDVFNPQKRQLSTPAGITRVRLCASGPSEPTASKDVFGLLAGPASSGKKPLAAAVGALHTSSEASTTSVGLDDMAAESSITDPRHSSSSSGIKATTNFTDDSISSVSTRGKDAMSAVSRRREYVSTPASEDQAMAIGQSHVATTGIERTAGSGQLACAITPEPAKDVKSINDLRSAPVGKYKTTFIVTSCIGDSMTAPADFFEWICPMCGIRLSFENHYSNPFQDWIRCVQCSRKEDKSVQFDLISKFLIKAADSDDSDQLTTAPEIEILIEGEAARSVFGIKAKYLWQCFRNAPAENAKQVKSRFENLMSKRQTAEVEVKMITGGSSIPKRAYVISVPF